MSCMPFPSNHTVTWPNPDHPMFRKEGRKPNERIAERLRNIIEGKEKQDSSWCGKRDNNVMKPDASLVAIRESECCPMCDVVVIETQDN